MINAELKHYKKIFLKDEVLITEGETGSEILLLEKGIVDVLIKGKKVNSIDASVSKDFVGEIGAILGTPRTATLVAATDVVTLCLPNIHLEAVLQEAPSIGLKLVKSLCEKLSNSASALADFQTKHTSILSSGSTDISLRNYMKGLFYIMELCVSDQTGETGKDLVQYFLKTNPWGIQHGDKNQVTDFDSCKIRITEVREPDGSLI
jgi:CRP-like cAMP-binding protein